MKRLLLIAAVAFAGWYWAALKTDADFQSCHRAAMDVVQLDQKSRTIPYPIKEWHDLVDDRLNNCMLGKGYKYDPHGWERCPTEKLQSCYRLGISNFL